MSNDSWETPQYLFDQLNEEFHFDVDLCATQENTKCKEYGIDYLNDRFSNPPYGFYWISGRRQTAFMNPPYSNPLPFVQKAWEDSKYCKIVMLLPVRTSTRWWKIFYYSDNFIRQEVNDRYRVNGYGPKPGAEVRFLPKRVAFVKDGKEVKGTSFDSCLVILDRRNK